MDSQVSGRDPKPFDAGLTPSTHLYALEINRPFESWVVLGRTGGEFGEIRWDDLGLDPKKRYAVFEFWERRLLSPEGESFAPGPIAAAFNSQVFIIRERLPHPQVVATSRHITGGGVDLLDVSWKDGVLSGRSRVVGGEPYEIFVTEATGGGWRRSSATGRRRCQSRVEAASRSPAVRRRRPARSRGGRGSRGPAPMTRSADPSSSEPTRQSSEPTDRRQSRLTIVRTD